MTIVAFDGHHNLHRCLHVPVFQSLSSNGVPTGGVYGGLQTIRHTLDHFNARECVVVWDGGYSTYRKELYPAYKANREPKTSAEQSEKEEYLSVFGSQKILMTRVLHQLGCRILELSGVEGDDVLCAITRVNRNSERKLIIVSEDMDLAQLVANNVQLYRPVSDVLITVENFVETVGLREIGINRAGRRPEVERVG